MKYFVLYACFLFIGLPLIMVSVHLATLPEPAKQGLSEVVKDFNGRIYTARIACPRSSGEHTVRIHGRDPEDARRKLTARLQQCDIDILDNASAPIWQKALRRTY